MEVGGRYFSGCFNCELRLGDFERWGSRVFGRGIGIGSLFGEYAGLRLLPPHTKELLSFLVCSQLSDVVLSEWKRKEKAYNFLSLSLFLFSSLFFFFFFLKLCLLEFLLEAFGDVARKASVLSLDASQDSHWVNFPGYTPLLAYQVLFISRSPRIGRVVYWGPAMWASGSV